MRLMKILIVEYKVVYETLCRRGLKIVVFHFCSKKQHENALNLAVGDNNRPGSTALCYFSQQENICAFHNKCVGQQRSSFRCNR